MSFVTIPKPFDENLNFWELNPLIKNISPFSAVYKTDDGGKKSSDTMWCVTFMCHPDEDENILFRYSEKERLERLNEIFPKVDLHTGLFDECVQIFPFECLDSVGRSLYALKNALVSRARLLKETEYTLDNGKDLDTMHKNTKAIYADLQRVIQEFTSSKEDDLRIKGGRTESHSERGEL